MAVKAPKVTVKQARFVKGIAEGKKKRDAARDAGYSGSPETLSVTASEVLKKPNVQEALQAELEKQGITLEKIVRPITNALNSDSVETQLKGHDRAMRIVAPRLDTPTFNFNFGTVVNGDREKYGI